MGIPIEIGGKSWRLYDIVVECFRGVTIQIAPEICKIYYPSKNNRYIVSCAYDRDIQTLDQVVREFGRYLSDTNPDILCWDININMASPGHQLTGKKSHEKTVFITTSGCTIGPPTNDNYPVFHQVIRACLIPRFFVEQIVYRIEEGLSNPLQISQIKSELLIDQQGVHIQEFIYFFVGVDFSCREDELIELQQARVVSMFCQPRLAK